MKLKCCIYSLSHPTTMRYENAHRNFDVTKCTYIQLLRPRKVIGTNMYKTRNNL